jgi:hypothetical protein
MMFKKIEGGNLEINPDILITEVATKVHTERMKLQVKDRPDSEEAIVAELAERGINKWDAQSLLPLIRTQMAELYFANPDNFSLEKKADPDLGLDDRRVSPLPRSSKKTPSVEDEGSERLTYGEMSTDSGLKGDDIAHLDELSQDAEI